MTEQPELKEITFRICMNTAGEYHVVPDSETEDLDDAVYEASQQIGESTAWSVVKLTMKVSVPVQWEQVVNIAVPVEAVPYTPAVVIE